MQRYNQFAEVIKTDQGKRRYSTLYYPVFERKDTDIYVVAKASDRLDLLAYTYYGDTRYWVILARANKLHNATIRVPTGIRLRIPFPLLPDEIESLFINTQN